MRTNNQNERGESSFHFSGDLPEVYETLFAHGDGYVHVTETKRLVASTKTVDASEIPTSGTLRSGKDIYVSGAVMSRDVGSGTNGRCEDRDARQLTFLWVDLDRSDHGKSDIRYWTQPDIDRLIDELRIKPTVVLDSGGGWWLLFVLTEPVPLNNGGAGELLLARWKRYWIGLAEKYGRDLDRGVFNPGRIIRAPGSINFKHGDPREVRVLAHHPECAFEPAMLDEWLPAPEVPRPPRTPSEHNGDRVGDGINAEATVEKAVALLEKHGAHSPEYRNGRVYLTRPEKDAKAGHSVVVYGEPTGPVITFYSSAWLPGAVELRDENGASGTYDYFGLLVALEYEGDFTAAVTDLAPEPVRMEVDEVSGIKLPSDRRLYKEGDFGGAIEDLDEAAFIGPLADFFEVIEPNTEATVPAMGAVVLAGHGALLGKRVQLSTGATKQPANLYAIVAGPTSRGRKGTAFTEGKRLLNAIDPFFAENLIKSGFGSGESLIERLADPATVNIGGRVISDPHAQRLFLMQPEMAQALAKYESLGNTLTSTLRDAFDGVPLHRNIADKETKATNAHLSVVMGITPDELVANSALLGSEDGLLNRNLLVWSESDKYLPFGASDVEADIAAIGDRIRTYHDGYPHGTLMEIKQEDARQWWTDNYRRLVDRVGIPTGLHGATGRSHVQILRIALNYAVMEGAPDIELQHLLAADAWVRYSVTTLRALLGKVVADKLAGKILTHLRASPGRAVSRREVYDLFRRHVTGAEVDHAIDLLVREGLAFEFVGDSSGGRPPMFVIATTPKGGAS